VSASSDERARARYQDVGVAEGYDSWRYETARGKRRNRRDLAAIGRALDEAAKRGSPVRAALDLPCGTARLAPLFDERGIRALGADVSFEMLRVARRKAPSGFPVFQGNAEAIPLADRSCDAVFAIRFLFHLDRDSRRRVLAEARRVSRRWLVLDVRHRYNARWVGWRIRHALGVLPNVQHRFSRAGLEEELSAAGLRLCGIYPSRRSFGWASDKWTVLAERSDA
jgi:ubiquinone/menaquinone biosynthesis C-methylase UbiE